MEKDNIKIEEIKAYKVGCCGKIFKSLKGAKLHIANTAHNPATHSCQTCKYYIGFWNKRSHVLPRHCEFKNNLFWVNIEDHPNLSKFTTMHCEFWKLGKRIMHE